MTESLQCLSAIFTGYTFCVSSEAELQEAVERILKAEDIPYNRERTFGADRPDFYLVDPARGGSIAIELKTDGATMGVARQLKRYARHPEISAIMLVTTRSRHRGVPRLLGGKPVVVHVVEGSF